MRFTPDEDARLYRKLALELGPVISAALRDESVVEIAVNDDGFVRVERLGGSFEPTAERFAPARVVGLLKTIATMQEAAIDRRNPVLESWIPGNGARITGILPPVARAPIFTIRTHVRRVFCLDEYVEEGRMSARARSALRHAIEQRLNILVAGGTGTGKTTLLNALLREIEEEAPGARCGILEKTRELLTYSPHHFQLETDAYDTDLARLLHVALRMRPDRIVVGEVRGAEARTLVEAWNTGHPGGLASIHANSAPAALRRLEQLVAQGDATATVRADIAECVGAVVFLERGARGPTVASVLRVCGWGEHGYELEVLAGDEEGT